MAMQHVGAINLSLGDLNKIDQTNLRPNRFSDWQITRSDRSSD